MRATNAALLRHLKPKRLCRDAVLFDARGIAVAAAISAMQRETDGAGALPRQDFVAADMAIEHAANPTVRQRHQNLQAAAAGAAIGRLAVGAFGVAEVHDVVV